MLPLPVYLFFFFFVSNKFPPFFFFFSNQTMAHNTTTPFNFTPTIKKHPPFLFFSSTNSTPILHFNTSNSKSLSSSLSLSSSSLSTRVTTIPVEYAPPTPEFDSLKEIEGLKSLKSSLLNCTTVEEKVRVIDRDSRVKEFFKSRSKNGVAGFLQSVDFDVHELFLLKCLVAAGQEHVISSGFDSVGGNEFESTRGSLKGALHALSDVIEHWDNGGYGGFGKKSNVHHLKDEHARGLKQLLKTLADVEKFYDCIGGIIGYQIKVLDILAKSTVERQSGWSQHMNESKDCQFSEVRPPSGLDMSQDTEYASEAALWGIEGLPDLGEIYPLGGSADRLGLVDPCTGECLPAAMLPYLGRTLLEGLIRDLQAREYLYFKIYGKQCITPVAIMTSSAKNNHEHITSLCEKLRWFGRGQSNFKLFEQPLVPTVSAEDGQWLVTKPFVPVCKPGGHGVIWKLAYEKGVYQWFYDHGRKGATVRQVSNVVASTDCTLLALAGIGLHHGKKLGFASCKRNSGATEGINVLVENKNFDGKWAYGVSCIEYTEFKKFGITDGPRPTSRIRQDFPANTNILYVDLPSAELVGSSIDEKSLPGMVLNVQKTVSYVDQFGIRHSVYGGRLECTMQNIADNFLNTYTSRCYEGLEELDTYIVYNERRRVTSSAKKRRKYADKSLHQTPDGSLLDIMRNAYDLLTQSQVNIPKIEGNDVYADSGPPFLILLHPALGPLWEVIRQKFHGGSISKGSELQVEVAEFLWKNVELDGSMIILAENAMGTTTIDERGQPILQYGHRCGRCKFQNVKVQNTGINWNADENVYWKHDVQRFEELRVLLHGNAEFEATDVTLQGNHLYEVPDGYKMKITPGNTGLDVKLTRIDERMMGCGSWSWRYEIKGAHIQLKMVEL